MRLRSGLSMMMALLVFWCVMLFGQGIAAPPKAALPKPALPNILWIVAEDMSPTLGCYGDNFATTPNIDALASESVRYTNAFATAPVCSPSRACLINGCSAAMQGTHPMRSEFPLPSEMDGFPRLLRDRGYFTTNNEKTDYNSAAAKLIKENSWNRCGAKAHWRQRDGDQPFFAIFNLMTSHQSRTMVWPYEQFEKEVQSQLDPAMHHDPAAAPVPPYYPDTQLVRKTIARFYDCVAVMDQQVGELLKQLDEDGLTEDTIVFFYSDHGSGMPRHKRALYDSGMHVPLLVRFPEKYRSLSPTPPGKTSDRLVCFEDFGPTVLSLAGSKKLPSYMCGMPFLGKLDRREREFTFGHRDRVDEIMDMSRSVRGDRYLYIRNFMPHLGWNQQSSWIDQGAIRQDFYALAESSDMTEAQRQYLGGRRPVEELYDCRADPMNLFDLASVPQFQETLERYRGELDKHLRNSTDLGFVPEIDLRQLTRGTTPIDWAAKNRDYVKTARSVAMLVGRDGNERELLGWLSDKNQSARYWACVGCTAANELSGDTLTALERLLSDDSIAVQIEAANALVRHGQTDKAYAKLLTLLKHDDTTVLLHAARTVELIGDKGHREPMQALFDRYEHDEGDMAWFIRFTTTGYLSRLAE